MDALNWVDEIISAKDKRSESAILDALARADERERFKGFIDDFWKDIASAFGAALDAYNERTSDPSKKVQHQPLPTGEYTARKPTFPAGEFIAALNKTTRRIVCNYTYTVFGGKSSNEKRVLFIGISENCLFLQRDNGDHIAEDRIAKFVLADFLRRI